MANFSAYETQYRLFRWTGMAKNDFESRTKRILYSAYDILLTFSYTFFYLAYGYEVTVTAAELPFEELLLNGVSFLICLAVVGKRFFVLGKKQKVKDLYLRTKNDFEDPSMRNIKEADVIIAKFDRFYSRYINSMYVLGIFTVFLFCLPAYLNFPEVLPFPIPFYKYLSQSQMLAVIIWQTILIWVGYLNFLAYDSLVWGFLMLIATRMQVIAKMCEQFTESYPSIDFKKYVPEYRGYPVREESCREARRKYRSYDEYMRHDDKIVRDTVRFVKQNVNYYREITEEIGILENVYSFPLLIQMFGGAALIGFTIVFVITGGFFTWYGLRTFAFFLCTITDLFCFSYYGTKVQESKNALIAAVYGCPWHEGDVSTEKLFLYTMSMMRNKLQYTSGGFIPINLETYLSLLKFSYNLLAVFK